MEQAEPLRLVGLVDQRQGLAGQLGGAGGVAGRIGCFGAARQERYPVQAGARLGVGDPVPQCQRAFELQRGLGEGVHLLGGGGGLDAGGQGPWLVAGCRPVVGQARRLGRPWAVGLGAGVQGACQCRVQADPLAGEELAVDRLGDQRMAEVVAVAIGLGA